nr:hypothetical protein [Bacteroidota bacterium]
KELKIWFTEPASEWNEALPVGNGRLGAMVFGCIHFEHFSINKESLQDGEKVYQNLLELLRKSTLDNLFDNHPPFQIDGNFGGTAGIAEMLLQSHGGEVSLLPALPKAWSDGSVKGICARDGFVLDIFWQNGNMSKVKIFSNLGNPCNIRYRDKTVQFETQKGKTYSLNGNLEIEK